ncbi:MAG: hypothetical protein VR65_17305 [Desulfobulbaceae bacterium BRH_c16a]|nr:MAG: hypothetical protein VR65_17305 [Desulfobulbaceae bacterium BRH_c16a]
MINPFTAHAKITRMQQDALRSLYTVYPGFETMRHDWLLAETGRALTAHHGYIEELCRSHFVAMVFKIVKFLGGAERLTEDDIARFTSYVNDGGIRAMIQMLLAANKEQAFIDELQRLPVHIQNNAPLMLNKSIDLHGDFIAGFFNETYGSIDNTPLRLRENYELTRKFICRLVVLAEENLKQHRS